MIRDNYFTPAAAILDLVDAEDSPTLESLPSYTNTYVYGNIIDDTGPNYTSLLVHFGGDAPTQDLSAKPVLLRQHRCHHRQPVRRVADGSCSSWTTTGQTVYAANNIFYNAAATSGDSPSLFEFSGDTGNINFSPTNWVSPGWLASESARTRNKL